MSCPYPSETLDYWDGVANPIGDACYACGEWECEHNLNSPYPDFDPEEEVN